MQSQYIILQIKLNQKYKCPKRKKKCLQKNYKNTQKKKIQRILENIDKFHYKPITHEHFLIDVLIKGLPSKTTIIDSSKPWFIYWIVHSLDIMNKLDNLKESVVNSCIESLRSLECKETGGFAGGIDLMAHTATTYSAVNALIALGTPEAYKSINKASLYKFFMSVKNRNGSFSVHIGGESDVRGTYTVISLASILNILTPELVEGVAEWVSSCQTYEGGISGEPGDEAHGGYAFCGFATLKLLKKTHFIDLDKFTKWTVNRQLKIEGGYQGRTNKLVDGCYSFWVGALPTLIQQENNSEFSFCDYEKLAKYILGVSQSEFGGFRDKPGINVDLYHTCYCLSGLSIALDNLRKTSDFAKNVKLKKINCLHNLTEDKYKRAVEYFRKN